MTIMYFDDISTVKGLRDEFKRLANVFKNEPQVIGQIINDYRIKLNDILLGKGFSNLEASKFFDVEKEYITTIFKIAKLKGIIMEVQAEGIKVIGDTFPYKDALRMSKFVWHTEGRYWFFKFSQT